MYFRTLSSQINNCTILGPSFCSAAWLTRSISESCGRIRLSTSSRNVFSALRWPFRPIGGLKDEEEDKHWWASAQHRRSHTSRAAERLEVWLHVPEGKMSAYRRVSANPQACKPHIIPRTLTLSPEAEAPFSSGDLAVPVGIAGVEEGPNADLILV